MRAFLYARFSVDEPDTLRIPAQLDVCRRHAVDRDWTVAGESADDGISGTILERRPGLEEVLRAAQARKFDVLIIRDQARLARSTKLLGHLRWLIENECGLSIVCVLEAHASEVELEIRGVFDAEYARRIRQLVILKMRGKAARGEYCGGRVPSGYRWTDGRAEIDPETAAPPRMVYRLYQEGTSIRQIARQLGWPLDRVSRTLRSPWYAGAYVWGRTRVRPRDRRQEKADPSTAVIIWDHHEALIPRGEWEAVQRRLSRQVDQWSGPLRPGTGSRLALSGLLRCGECGAAMSVAAASRPRLDGVRTHYYGCHKAHNRKSDCPGVGYWPVRGWVSRLLADLAQLYSAPERIAELRNDLGGEAGERLRRRLRAETRRQEASIKAIYSVLRSGRVKDSDPEAINGIADQLQGAHEALRAAQQAEAELQRAPRRIPSAQELAQLLQAMATDLETLSRLGEPENIHALARPILHRCIEEIQVQRSGRVIITARGGAVLGDSVANGLGAGS